MGGVVVVVIVFSPGLHHGVKRNGAGTGGGGEGGGTGLELLALQTLSREHLWEGGEGRGRVGVACLVHHHADVLYGKEPWEEAGGGGYRMI